MIFDVLSKPNPKLILNELQGLTLSTPSVFYLYYYMRIKRNFIKAKKVDASTEIYIVTLNTSQRALNDCQVGRYNLFKKHILKINFVLRLKSSQRRERIKTFVKL